MMMMVVMMTIWVRRLVKDWEGSLHSSLSYAALSQQPRHLPSWYHSAVPCISKVTQVITRSTDQIGDYTCDVLFEGDPVLKDPLALPDKDGEE